MSAGLVWAPLGPLALVVGALSIAVYLLVLTRRPYWVRLLNGSGLLFTGMALLPAASMTPRIAAPDVLNFEALVVLTVLAALAQIAAAFRNRRAWNGGERRKAAAWDGAERRGVAAAPDRETRA